MDDDIFKSLREASDAFLKNMERANKDATDTKEQLKSRGLLSIPVGDDTFGRGLDRIKRLRAARPSVDDISPSSDVVSAPLSGAPLPSNMRGDDVELKEVLSDLPSTTVFSKMIEVSQHLGRVYMIKPELSWSEMDRISALIRSDMVQLMGKGQTSSFPHVIPLLFELSQDVLLQSPSWGIHAQAWTSWAQNWIKELPLMSQWLNIELNVFWVPDDFPIVSSSLPSTTDGPLDFVSMLEKFDRFAQWQMKKGVRWTDTPAQHAFLLLQNRLNDFVPQTSEQHLWKENTLDWMCVTLGRLTLSEANTVSPDVSKDRSANMSRMK